ncbi:MAG: Nramp family divalent metal transporter [Armatimonadetes bacterium]|nr:Nramp family divalent metal transporter [Armatimonadota bacterium]
MRRLGRNRLLMLFAFIGPGVITAAADNDAGGITTYSVAGALYRYDLLWVIVIITFVLAMIQEMCARMGVVTQKGLGELIRENFGVKWTMFALGTLLVANLATTTAEFAGLAASLEIFGITRYITVPIAAIGIWLLVVKGSFRTVERVFLALTLIYATYVVSGIMAHPNWSEVAHATFVPKLNLTPNFIFLAIAVIGTTITPWMQFFLQATVVEKGVRLENYTYQKWDVYIGSLLTDLVSFFIIVAAGATVYGTIHGQHVKDAAQVAKALEPVAGRYAEALFAIGLFNASLLAAAVLPLSTAYTYSEAFGWEIGISRKFSEAPIFYSIYTFSILFGVLVVLMPKLHLIDTMINAQAINGILLPVILVFMLKLINRPDVMGKYTNSKVYNIAVWAMAVALMIMTVMWLFGLARGY